MPPDQ